MPSRWGAARVYDLGASKGGEWWRLGVGRPILFAEVFDGFDSDHDAQLDSGELDLRWGTRIAG